MNLKALLLVAALTPFGAPARAALVSVTFEGTIVSSADTGGIFGIPHLVGVAYQGMPFSAVFHIDSDNVGVGIGHQSTAYGLEGGTRWGVPGPILQASMTINGHTQSVAPLYQNFVRGGAYGFPSVLQIDARMRNETITQIEETAIGVHYIAFDNSVPSTFPSLLTLNISGSVTLNSYVNNLGLVFPEANINGRFDSVTFAPLVASVPEPSTWAMMLMGFAGLGVAARRRKLAAA